MKRSRAVTSALTFNLCITICDFWLLSYSVLAITLIFVDYFLKKLPLKKKIQNRGLRVGFIIILSNEQGHLSHCVFEKTNIRVHKHYNPQAIILQPKIYFWKEHFGLPLHMCQDCSAFCIHFMQEGQKAKV